MKKSILIAATLSLISTSFADTLCPELFVTDSSKIKTILKNTQHDYYGNNDEITLSIGSSDRKINEEDMFSDWAGATFQNLSINSLGRVETKAPFHKTALTSDLEVKQELLYNRYLNLVMVDRDLAAPLGSGSIEVPVYFATGGNHDDLIFSKSLKLDLLSHHGHQSTVRNNLGDELEITVSPSVVRIVARKDLEEEYSIIRGKLDNIQKSLKLADPSSMHYFKLNRDFDQTYSKATYLKDILAGIIEGSCANR
jgi:hypothetical protein